MSWGNCRAIVTSATYPPSDATKTWLCASGTPTVTCNKPLTTKDANLNVTTYAWDSTTGLPTSVTRPAPTTGAVQPQTRYSYSSIYAQYLSGGSLVNFATPVTRLTGISQCQTTSSCAGGADEVKSSITYGTANALPVSASSGAGDGSLTATSGFTYDTVGNRLTVDGPLSGTADTTRTRCDADREVIGVVDPDPDAASEVAHPKLGAQSSIGARTGDRLWISESFERHSSPLFWSALTFPLGLRLAMIQRFSVKAQRVAVFGGGLGT